jgi:GGDEF domain-containing protein
MTSKVEAEVTLYPEQSKTIDDMIKSVGMAMYEAKKSTISKSKAFADAQVDFRNVFGVHNYLALPIARYEEAVTYLTHRWQHFRPGLSLPNVFCQNQKTLF